METPKLASTAIRWAHRKMRRQGKGRDRDHLLAGHREGLAAGGEDTQAGSGAQHVRDQLRRGREQVLAVVDDEEHGRVAQVRKDQGARLGGGLVAEVERRHDRVGDERRVLDVGKLHQPCPSGAARTEVGADLQREARLADTTGADKAHQAPVRKLAAELRDLLATADEAGRLRRKVPRAVGASGHRQQPTTASPSTPGRLSARSGAARMTAVGLPR